VGRRNKNHKGVSKKKGDKSQKCLGGVGKPNALNIEEHRDKHLKKHPRRPVKTSDKIVGAVKCQRGGDIGVKYHQGGYKGSMGVRIWEKNLNKGKIFDSKGKRLSLHPRVKGKCRNRGG